MNEWLPVILLVEWALSLLYAYSSVFLLIFHIQTALSLVNPAVALLRDVTPLPALLLERL